MSKEPKEIVKRLIETHCTGLATMYELPEEQWAMKVQDKGEKKNGS